MKQINILDLFSGIGGFSLAAQRAGFEINKHYFSEIDKYAESIYRKQFPDAIRLGDITKIGNDLEKIDIITGRFPCQAFSIAGKRRGFEDTRGTLFFEIERLARFYRPKYMVLENVKGLFSHEKGNTIRIILDKLRGLDYTIQLLLLNTKDFGIPQNRERLFFICNLRGQFRPEISDIRSRKTEIDEKRNGKSFHAGCISTKNASGQCNFDGGSTLFAIPVKNNKGKLEKTDNAICIDSNYYKGIDNHGQRTCILLSDSGQGRKRELRNISPPLRAHDGCGHDNYTFENSIIRRLTPIECERLQDYPDNWTKYGKADNSIKVPISDTQRYKCCGNSITVKVAEEIFKSIYKVLIN